LNAEKSLTIYASCGRRRVIPQMLTGRRQLQPVSTASKVTFGGTGLHANRHAETGWPTPRSARSRRSANDLASGPPTAARVVSLISASLGSA